MRTRHEFTAEAVCPVDGSRDVYTVLVVTECILPVETILLEAARLGAEPIYQEEFTEQLCRALGVRVSTHGTHSGVETTCVARP